MLQERGIAAALDFDCREMPPAGPGENFRRGPLRRGGVPSDLPGRPHRGPAHRGGGGQAPRQARRRRQPPKLLSYTDLTVGDLVVHTHHGVGRFEGIRKMPVDGVEKDYIKIAYAGGDSLYVPRHPAGHGVQVHRRGRRRGGRPPRQAQQAGGHRLVEAEEPGQGRCQGPGQGPYRPVRRAPAPAGLRLLPDSPWQQEFEEAFDYPETEDQLRCIAEIKKDMERPVPMDRLLCGDVGYGKTEVALRAVMKCVLDGKQAAILVPTTVLAQQHFATAVNRFRSFPVEIRVLSRFQTPGQARQILSDLAAGHIDLLIGTHKLLQKDIHFKDLGCWWWTRSSASASPTRRSSRRWPGRWTCSRCPPPPSPDAEHGPLRHSGHVHPWRSPPGTASRCRPRGWSTTGGCWAGPCAGRSTGRPGLLPPQPGGYHRPHRRPDPEAPGGGREVVVGHGKMGERQLSSVMQQMVEGTAQVLVCTTISETGIDIANVNTLIIEDADKMGLSQLHQIRGRIGRSARRAYAYMTYRRGKVLSEIASKRLTAIKGVRGVRLRVQDRHAGPGDPGGGEPAGPGAVRVHDERGLRHVPAAAGGRGAGGEGRGEEGGRGVLRGPDGERQPSPSGTSPPPSSGWTSTGALPPSGAPRTPRT